MKLVVKILSETLYYNKKKTIFLHKTYQLLFKKNIKDTC